MTESACMRQIRQWSVLSALQPYILYTIGPMMQEVRVTRFNIHHSARVHSPIPHLLQSKWSKTLLVQLPKRKLASGYAMHVPLDYLVIAMFNRQLYSSKRNRWLTWRMGPIILLRRPLFCIITGESLIQNLHPSKTIISIYIVRGQSGWRREPRDADGWIPSNFNHRN